MYILTFSTHTMAKVYHLEIEQRLRHPLGALSWHISMLEVSKPFTRQAFCSGPHLIVGEVQVVRASKLGSADLAWPQCRTLACVSHQDHGPGLQPNPLSGPARAPWRGLLLGPAIFRLACFLCPSSLRVSLSHTHVPYPSTPVPDPGTQIFTNYRKVVL